MAARRHRAAPRTASSRLPSAVAPAAVAALRHRRRPRRMAATRCHPRARLPQRRRPGRRDRGSGAATRTRAAGQRPRAAPPGVKPGRPRQRLRRSSTHQHQQHHHQGQRQSHRHRRWHLVSARAGMCSHPPGTGTRAAGRSRRDRGAPTISRSGPRPSNTRAVTQGSTACGTRSYRALANAAAASQTLLPTLSRGSLSPRGHEIQQQFFF
jgi:hypothetical protein